MNSAEHQNKQHFNNEPGQISLLIGIQNVQLEMMNLLQNLQDDVSNMRIELSKISKKEEISIKHTSKSSRVSFAAIDDCVHLENEEKSLSQPGNEYDSISLLSYNNDDNTETETSSKRSFFFGNPSKGVESVKRSTHLQRFVNLVEDLQTGFANEQHVEKELENSIPLEFLKESINSHDRIKRRLSSCRDVMKMNFSISCDIEDFGNSSFVAQHKEKLCTSFKKTEKSFKNFAFLSADETSLLPENVMHWGKNNFSPIILKSGGIIDQFPSKQTCAFDSLSTFCFPHGLSIRIIPKCGMEGAKKLGWFGREADRFQLHAFHDINGNTTHGVAITVREVVNLPNQFVSDIKSLRLKRKYVDKITSAWSSHKLCQENIELNEAVKGTLTKAVTRWSKRLSSDSVINEEAYQEGQQHPSFKKTMLEPINHNSNERIKKPTSQLASKLAAESYKQMIDNFELGDICIVEQCYILLGTKPEHNSLLLSALQNLVNFEAPSKQDFIFDKMLACKSFVHDRHDILEEYQSKLSLPSDVNTKRINKVRKYEMIALDLNFSFPAIVYSLPLPQTSNEYGIAQLILRFKLPMLLNVLILLLLERSVLIIGDKSEDVSSCAFALLDLLKPYKWASVFLPSLSEDMIDFVTAPVPFIAAMVGKDVAALKRIEMDSRVKDERMTGLTVIDVTSCKILWTEEVEIRKNMFARVRSMM